MSIKLSQRMGGLRESATLALNARAKQMAAEGKTVFNLTAGELASETPGFIVDYVGSRLNKNKYTAVAGLPELRALVADHYRNLVGKDWIQTNNIVMTAGAKPALYATFLSFINNGDEVIIPTPSWVSYNHLIELAGGKVVEVPTSDLFELDIEAISHAITKNTRAILINSPNNPTGATYNATSLLELCKVANKHDLLVISDEIYSTLIYDDEYCLPSTFDFNNLVIINGFSKSQALTGWRIGYIIAPDNIAAAATNILSHVNGNAPLPSQYAAIAAMQKGDRPPQSTLETLTEQRLLVDKKLKLAKGLRYVLPKGAFYFFLDLRNLTDDSAKWCEDLLVKNGVALVPGEAFSSPGFARLTFVCDRDTLDAALDEIVKFINKQEV